MIDLVIFVPLFTLGLVSSAHCIGMCGGIMGALTMAIPADARAQRWIILVAYNLGRITSYTLMGLLAGFFAEQFAALGGGVILRILAGVLLIVMGLYLADWWRGLTKLEAIGRYLWVYIQPLGKGLMPVNTLPKALLLGALWGWLPCGLVYAALAMAMTQPAPLLAAGAMFAFGLGTLPAVLAAGFVAQQLARILQRPQVRWVLALVIIMFGLWTIWGSLGHIGGHHHHSAESPATATHDHSHMQHDMAEPSAMDHSAMDHSMMDHSHMDHSTMHEHQDVPDATLERQRTDADSKLEDDKGSTSSSVQASETNVGEHHHE